MKIDLDYMKKLLLVFETANSPTINIRDLMTSGFEDENNLEFYLALLTDKELIATDNGSYGFGLEKGADGHRQWSAIPLRLTAEGHDFLKAIKDHTIFEILKKNFKDASIGILIETAKQLTIEKVQHGLEKLLKIASGS